LTAADENVSLLDEQSVNPSKRSFSRNHALASEAGRKGGHRPKKAGDQE
jgi:uncharacterized protein